MCGRRCIPAFRHERSAKFAFAGCGLDVAGTFYLVDHGTDISSKVHEAEAYTFSDGTITGADVTGTYSVTEGTDDITITLDGKTYQGVLIEMEDEAGNPVLCFSAAGTSNESIWGVKYLKE